MKKSRKLAAGIGIVALVGAALWMRELASWRPVTLVKFELNLVYMVMSRDGQTLLVGGMSTRPKPFEEVLMEVGAAGGAINLHATPAQRSHFWKQGAPRPWIALNQSRTQFIFSPAPGKKVLLAGKIHPHYFDLDASNSGASHFAWSKARGEIYRESYGEISTWDCKSGRLKKRYFAFKPKPNSPRIVVSFSPDGQSLLTSTGSLLRYDVPTGKLIRLIHRSSQGAGGSRIVDFGWSPDGKSFWFVRRSVAEDYLDFNVLRATDSALLWSAPCAGPSKWLPDGRIGLMEQGGFSWRDASGREIGHLPGPLAGSRLADEPQWEATPDGNWIYSCEEGGIIRRWRAK